MIWYEHSVSVPFGQGDSLYGGAHDMAIACPPNTLITALLGGTIETVTSPPWGIQIGIKLDVPYNGIPYMAYLHLAAVFPDIHIGLHIGKGYVIGYSGGCNTAAQYNGTSNPTGHNFLNTPQQSSQPQVGIALMRGPVYGVGAGWTPKPDPALDPTSLIILARKIQTVASIAFSDREKQVWRLFGVALYEQFAIAQSWVAALRRTHYFGPALESEVSEGDYQCQAFACAYAKWNRKTGHVAWFTYQGEYILP
jgi:hypothetical protein